MQDSLPREPMNLMPPTMAEADRAVRQARRLFHRTLAAWAQDVMLLRQRRLAACSWGACPPAPEPFPFSQPHRSAA